MKNKLFTVAFWLPVLFSVCLILMDSFQAEYTPRDEATHDTTVILERFKRFNDATVDIRLDTMKELVRNEYDRFKHIDAKATTFIGMLSISLTVFASLGGALGVNILSANKPDADNKQKVTGSNNQKLVSSQYLRRIIILYSGTLVLLLSSFFLAMLATRVPYAPSSEFIWLEIPGRYDVDPEVVIGEDEDNIGLNHVQYQRELLGQLVNVYATNAHTNNVKATRLSRSQLYAFVAGVTLVGISFMAIMGVIWGPPNQKLRSTTVPSRGKTDKVLEAKSA
jgi:hypothetical protein